MRQAVCLLLFLLACGSPPPAPTPTPTPVRTPTPVVTHTPTPTPTVDIRGLVREGSELALAGKHERAIPILEQALAASPDDPEIHQWLFTCYSKTEKTPSKQSKAYLHARKVVELEGGVRAKKAREYLEAAENAGAYPRGTGKRPADVTHFQGVKLGMTEEQVKKALGARLKPFSGQYANPGHYVPFCLPREYIGKKFFTVLFPFDNETGKLDGIYIRPVQYPSGTQQDFEDMLDYLTSVYGPPEAEDNLDSEFMSRQRLIWRFQTTEIHLNLYGGGDLSVTMLPPP